MTITLHQKYYSKFCFIWIFCLLISSLQGAIFTVSTNADNGDDISPIPGSLREAIINSNVTPGPNAINFAIPGAGPFVIQPLIDLPPITNTVVIDGYTQPGSSPNTLGSLQGTNAVLQIIINGNLFQTGDGLTSGNGLFLAVGSDNSTISGLVLNEWILAGININSNDNQILGNFIGTDVTGTLVDANIRGVLVYADLSNPSANIPLGNIIGGSDPANLNLVAGSAAEYGNSNPFNPKGASITIQNANQTTVQGNLIGTDRTGTKILGNSVIGIQVDNSEDILIGGELPNIISGQTIFGVSFFGVINMNVVNNFIGTDVTGTLALGNLNAGIYAFNYINTFIIANLVSGNGQGIEVIGLDSFYGKQAGTYGSYTTVVSGNYIGLDITGTQALGNQRNGIYILSDGATISENVVSANGENGILIASNTSNTELTSNYIGTDATGTLALGNANNGIQLGLIGGNNAAFSNTIGGVGNLANLIAGNKHNGIQIEYYSYQNIIQGNFIGSSLTFEPIPNEKNGIYIVNSSNNLIGGNSSSLGLGNVIAYNLDYGVKIATENSVNNSILTNSIFANQKKGIRLEKKKPRAPHLEKASTRKITCSLTGLPQTTYLVQFFNNGSSKQKEGKQFIGETFITLKKSQTQGTFSIDSPGTISPGDRITATSTAILVGGFYEATSEFSQSIPVSH